MLIKKRHPTVLEQLNRIIDADVYQDLEQILVTPKEMAVLQQVVDTTDRDQVWIISDSRMLYRNVDIGISYNDGTQPRAPSDEQILRELGLYEEAVFEGVEIELEEDDDSESDDDEDESDDDEDDESDDDEDESDDDEDDESDDDEEFEEEEEA